MWERIPGDLHTTPRLAGRVHLQLVALAVAGLAMPAWSRPLFQPEAPTAWTVLGGAPNRTSITSEPIPSIASARWVRTTDSAGLPITFVAHACPVTDGEIVVAIGRVRPAGAPVDSHRVLAFDAATGAPLWHAAVQAAVTDSISTPLIDTEHGAVIHASGATLTAHDLGTGTLLWQRPLARPIVNASPVITTDRGNRDRIFITDFDGFGTLASLYCINADAFDAAQNPYQPGAIVWTVAIGGASGNSASYAPLALGGTDRVFVASVGDFGFTGGVVFAIDIESGNIVWQATNPAAYGFFGGLCITPDVDGNLCVFAATYAFGGDTTSASLLKLNASTGAVVWSSPCNRTQTIPAVSADGRVVVSGGIRGFGTVPSIELFEDLGSSVQRLWHSALDTWTDLDNDSELDLGEFLAVGGWIAQPLVTLHAGQHEALVSVPSPTGSFFAPPEQLVRLDLNAHPSATEFILESAPGAGGSASVSGGLAFSIGVAGLTCFGTPAYRADVDTDGFVTIDDLRAWERGDGRRDVDRSGVVNASDKAALVGVLRQAERADWIPP